MKLNLLASKIFLTLSFLMISSLLVFSQESGTVEEKQAKFFIKVFEYTEWPNESEIEDYTIGVLGDTNNIVFNEIINQTKDKKVKEKHIKVKRLNSLSEVNNIHILYLDKSFDLSINQIYKTLNNRPIMLMTKGYPFGQSMINFLFDEDKLQYELNEQKCEDVNLKISPILTIVAIKSKNKWDNLLGKMTSLVESNDKTVEVNTAELSKIIKEQELLMQEITANTKKLDTQKEQLKAQTDELTKQKNELAQKEAQIANAKKEIENQQKLISTQLAKIQAQQDNLEHLNNDVILKQQEVAKQHAKLEQEKQSLLAIQKEYAQIEKNLKEKELLVKEQNKTIDAQGNEIITKESTIQEQKSIIWLSVIFLIIVSILGALAYRSYRLKNKANATILAQKSEIEEQHKVLEEQHREITDSINYAKRIQEAILPPLKLVKGYMPDSFILYQPKDIVAGDFYWMEGVNNLIIFAVADCTGHGVPGAMVSVVCHNAMNRAVKEFMLVKPNEILDKTREIVLETFEKSDEDVNDGMDIALCSINTENKKLSYSGANNGLYLIRDGELTQVKPDKQPIGNYQDAKPFTLHEFDLKKGDVLYTFSDGYPDQFGGPKGKKFMYKNFRNLLLDIHQKPMNEQHSVLVKAFEEWRGAHQQIDDVCVIGVRI